MEKEDFLYKVQASIKAEIAVIKDEGAITWDLVSALPQDPKLETKPFIQDIKPGNPNIQDLKHVISEVSNEDLKINSLLNCMPDVKFGRNQDMKCCIYKAETKSNVKEESGLLNFDLKPSQDFIPVIKLERNKEIEFVVSEAKRKIKVDDLADEKYTSSEADFDSVNSSNDVKNHSTKQDIPNYTFFICEICNECYRTRSLLDNHSCSKISHNIDRRRCEGCLKIFFSKEHFASHKCSGIKKTKMFECGKCKKYLSSKKSFKLHQKCCKTKIECEKCRTRFGLLEGFIEHMKVVHNIIRPFYCKECGQRFSKKRDLNSHLRRHRGEFPYFCHECGKGFTQSSTLITHISIHHQGDKPHRCDQCGKRFAVKSVLNRHKKVTHGPVIKPFKCPSCEKWFSNKHILGCHKKIHQDERNFMCDFCDKSFYRQDHLKVHLRIHTGEKPYGCDYCGKRFAQNSSLTLHKRTHSQVRSYECKECGATFKLSTSLNVHLRIHTNSKPYKCEFCGKCFSQNSNYHSHVRSIHHKSVRAECDICGKVFGQKNNVISHVKTMHDEKLYKCGVCKKSVKSKYFFHKHVQMHLFNQPEQQRSQILKV